MAAILKTVQIGELELWMNMHKTDRCISLNDSDNMDFSETDEKKLFFVGKVQKIAKYAFQCGGHLVRRH